jgi:hypothetical protein
MRIFKVKTAVELDLNGGGYGKGQDGTDYILRAD